MNIRFYRPWLGASLLALIVLPLAPVSATDAEQVGASYHGQLGIDTGLGMLEKWCALPNFSFDRQGGIGGWTAKDCNNCHIGADWNPTRPQADCNKCHEAASAESATPPTIATCMAVCHKKDIAKRGDQFTAEYDVHIAAGYVCQDCHLRVADDVSDHQFLKGTAIDTTEPTMKGTLSCTTACHDPQPHSMATDNGVTLNVHTEKVACETCHTGLRYGAALESRSWARFVSVDPIKPVTVKRSTPWLPDHKWYDNTGPGASGDYHLPILSHTERRGLPGAKIYPFNPVTVEWFLRKKNSSYDDVIVPAEVAAADADGDLHVTLDEMQDVYRKAQLVTADMNFSISHSIGPADTAFRCNDCHGKRGWVLDWKQLGYPKDPRGGPGGKKK
ncbi:MAG: hypothetical protein KJO72_00945 [Gammaproteobacteria bacterium]|nr:hypothetical protein [Gammaproteobacteria bacterium]